MATRKQSGASTGREQQQDRSASTARGNATGRSAGGATEQGNRGGEVSPAAGGQRAGQRAEQGAEQPDRERQRPVEREGGMQRGTQRDMQRGAGGGGLARQQPSSLPALLAAPPGLLAGAFMANPFEFMRRLNADMDRIFDEAGAGGGAIASSGMGMNERGLAGRMGGATGWSPQVETFQRGNELVLRADLPGVKKEDIHIDVEDGVLTLSGERRQEHEDREEGSYRSERRYGSFFRAMPLPDGVDEERISASCDHGVLEVTVPLPEQKERRGRRVEIR